MAGTQIPLHKVTSFVRKRRHDIDNNNYGQKRWCEAGEQAVPMFHPGRQERSGAGWVGKERIRPRGLPAGCEGPWAPRDAGGESILISEVEMPPSTASQHFQWCCLAPAQSGQKAAWDSHRGRPAWSQPAGGHDELGLCRNLGGGVWTAPGYGIWRFETIFLFGWWWGRGRSPKGRRTSYWLWVILDFQGVCNIVAGNKCYEDE